MENIAEAQKVIKEIQDKISALSEYIKASDINKDTDDDSILPKQFREILGVIRTKDVWKKSEIVTVFREVSLIRVGEQRLRRR